MRLMNLRQMMSNDGPMSFDASRALFRVGSSSKVSELLMAIPMLKGDPVIGVAPSTGASPFQMKVSVQRINSALPNVTYYDDIAAAGIAQVTNGLATAVDFPVARIALQFAVPKLDEEAVARNTAADLAEWKMYAATFGILRQIDKDLIAGTGSASPQNIKGLDALIPAARKVVTSGSIETDVGLLIKNVFPNGVGVGEGIHAILGNASALRALQGTTSGQRGQSGYRIDRRSGAFVYHYMGIPFYRCEVANSGTSSAIYGVNFGGTGLNLVYTHGSPETFGLIADSEPINGTHALDNVTVHGGFTLVLWEDEGAFAVTNAPVGTL